MSFSSQLFCQKLFPRLNSSILEKQICITSRKRIFQAGSVSYCTTTKRYSRRNKNQNFWPWLSFGGVIFGYLSIELLHKKRLTAFAAEYDVKTPFQGSASARPSGSSKRAAYNFVADVVDIAGNAVVYIERLQK